MLPNIIATSLLEWLFIRKFIGTDHPNSKPKPVSAQIMRYIQQNAMLKVCENLVCIVTASITLTAMVISLL